MYHKIILAGNLGRDPELRYLESGTPVCNFSVATTEKWNDRDGVLQERTAWWRVSVWGKQGENCNTYLSKGRQVLVEGKIKIDPETGGPRVYTRNDGTAGASLEVTAQVVRFMGGRGAAPEAEEAEDEELAPEDELDEDSIPF